MPSPDAGPEPSSPSALTSFRWLMSKEWRDLAAAKGWWLTLVATGPIVGMSFISAVRTYGEASGLNGTALGVGEAFSPLIGIWAPTFSACELVAAFLLPFVVIRLVAGDRQSGALKIEMQHPLPTVARLGAKALVLLGGWVVLSLAPAIAIALWMSYGGPVYVPEVASVAVGHLLNAGLTIALAATAAAVAEHPSTAAVLTLGVTVGTWMLSFVAAVQGGLWERAAAYTPAAMVARFQHGLVELSVVLVAIAFVAAGLALAAIWLRIGVSVRRRALESTALAAVAVVAVLVSSQATASWDLSENRANSFSRADEEALEQIRSPISIEVHLAPEDPRRVDLDRRALSRLRRLLPETEVRYQSATSIGLFEQTAPGYGEIWYELNGQRTMSRATTTEGVLEAIYAVAGVEPPSESDETPFRGHPLAAAPRHAAPIFYVAWPLAAAAVTLFLRRRLV